MEGIRLKKGIPIKVRDEHTKEIVPIIFPDEVEFDPEKIERAITAVDRNRKIVEEFSQHFKEGQKTLFFSVDDKHADQLVKRTCLAPKVTY